MGHSQVTEGHSDQMDRQTGHPGGGSQEAGSSSLASESPKTPTCSRERAASVMPQT